MVTKASKSKDTGPASGPAGDGTHESANPIWLAGLGAFAKAQAEGGKVFEALVREGSAIQRKTQAVAEEKMAEAAERMSSMASELSQRASGQMGKLEGIFEERVGQALKRLGVPTAGEVQALHDRIAALEKELAAARAAPRKAAAPKEQAAPRRGAPRKGGA